jgi:hypothetical protein
MKTINTSSIFNDHLVDSRKNLLMRLQEKAQLSIETPFRMRKTSERVGKMPKQVRKMSDRVRKTSERVRKMAKRVGKMAGEWEKWQSE